MLGTLPLRAAYLQQLLHICQALQFQPAQYTSPSSSKAQSLTRRTYSNSNVEAINSALAAQWSNPACQRVKVPGSAHSAAVLLEQASSDGAAAAMTASQNSSYDGAADAAVQHRQGLPSNEHSVSSITEQLRNSSLYQGYDQQAGGVPASPHGLMHNPFSPGSAYTSQTNLGQGLSQMAQTSLQKGKQADVAGDTGPHSAFGWSHPTQAQGQGRTDEGQLGQQGWAGQKQTGQGQSGLQDVPLSAAEYDAVVNLQSLARQLQASGGLALLCLNQLSSCLS